MQYDFGCQSEMSLVIMLDLPIRGQKQGSMGCQLRKKQEESIVSEWDNSAELGMRRVPGLEYRSCLSKWKRAVEGGKESRAALGSSPHYSCFHHY